MENAEYIFKIIPDLADKPQTYLIYKGHDRSKPVAHVVFENKEYTVAGDPNLTLVEQLDILRACDLFLRQRYFPEWE